MVEADGWSRSGGMDTTQDILNLIARGENLITEFKTGRFLFPENAFETICAFLNGCGGVLLLGVKDSGEIIGVGREDIVAIRQQFVEQANNPNLLDPPVQLRLEQYEIEDRTILTVNVPESRLVHRHKGKVFYRNESGDFDITRNQAAVASLYARKNGMAVEDRILPYLSLDALDGETIQKCRKLAIVNRDNHPWKMLDDLQLLQSVGLYRENPETKEKGLTMGAVLLLGTDVALRSVSACSSVDLLVRKKNVDRYDVRETIETNIVKSYDRMMWFIGEYLPDPFYTDGVGRMSLRSLIFREAFSNLLAHRDYSNPMMAQVVIGQDSVCIRNSSAPEHSMIPEVQMVSHPKNPNILRFLREIGYADELGSGIRNMRKYGKIYGGADPVFEEGHIFTATIHVPNFVFPAAGAESNAATVSEPDTLYQRNCSHRRGQENLRRLLDLLREPRTAEELKSYFHEADAGEFYWQHLEPAMSQGLIEECREVGFFQITEQGRACCRSLMVQD